MGLLVGLIAPVAVPATTAAATPDGSDPGRGKRVYARFCATCHGETGDGKGPTARALGIAPRNFVTATYRFRTTPSGALPSDDDLLRTVTWGVPGTEMPAWSGVLDDADRRAVVAFIKTLSPRFAAEPPAAPVAFPPDAGDGPAVRERGRGVYVKAQCAACHGDSGRGNGPSMATLRDDEGRPLPASDLTRRDYKGGSKPQDVERAILTGLDGAAMPSYADSLMPDEISALARYVLSLRRPRSLLGWLTEAAR